MTDVRPFSSTPAPSPVPEPKTVVEWAAPVEAPAPSAAPEPSGPSARPAASAAAAPGSRRARRAAKPSAMRVVGHGLTIFGLVVVAFGVYLVGVTRLEYGRAQRHLISVTKNELATQQAPIGGRIDPGTPVAMLEIPRLHLRAAVVEGTSASQLERAPGHLRTSPLPGQRGNVVIMGRRVAYGGPFRSVGRLRRGDVIKAATGQGRATYVVTGVRTTNRKGTNVLDDRGGNRLTLVTSSPEFLAERRLVVNATLRGDPVLTPFGRPTEVSQNELGLQADGSTVLALVLWAEVLLLAAVGAAWLYRRWGHWNTYLVTTPVLVLLLLLVFDSLTPILPSTL